MSNNLIMVDHSKQDPRSTSAMLREEGDGREQLWLEYQANRQEIFDQLYLMEAFSYAVHRRLIVPKVKDKPQPIYRKPLLLFCIIFIIF